MSNLRPGHQLNHALRIERRLGQGGMGTVYLAHDELLDRRVAVKVLDRVADVERAALQTLLEGRAAARVVHPHVVAVHAIGDADGRAYMEMEYVEGQSLRQVLHKGVPERPLAATWLAQVAAALTTAHELGVVHCDVKPENVLIRDRNHAAKLADFGLARSQADGRADAPLSHGTLAYLAPELLDGAPTPAADQFALAVVATELLAGVRPTRVRTEAMPELPDAPQVPERAREVLLRALSVEPEKRFASAAVFVDALLRGLGLPHLRGPLVGMSELAQADTSKTSSELPVPFLHIALHPLPLADQVLAALAVLPSGYPGALRETLGLAPAPDVLAELKRAGRIDGVGEDWRWAGSQPREAALRRLTPRQRRQVCARAAMAVELCGAKRETTREDATRLYLAARRLKDAARLAQESAAVAKTALHRDHHLARAVALLTSQTDPLPWLHALLARLDWLLACGWLAAARGTLAEAQGVLADTALTAEDPARMQVNLAAARLRAATGDPAGAAVILENLLAKAPASTSASARLALQTAQASALLAAGRPHDAWLALALHVGHVDPEGEAFAWALAGARLVAAEALLHSRHRDHAALLAGQALATAEESGDPMLSSRALLVLAELARLRQQRERQSQWLVRARKQLAALGPTELTGLWHMRQAEFHADAGQTLAALAEVERAAACFAVMGVTRHDAAIHELRDRIGFPGSP